MSSKVRNDRVFLQLLAQTAENHTQLRKNHFQKKTGYIHNDNHCMHYQRALAHYNLWICLQSISGSGLHLKKKNVTSLVQKWQKVKKEVEIEERNREEREQAIRQKLEVWKQEYSWWVSGSHCFREWGHRYCRVSSFKIDVYQKQ